MILVTIITWTVQNVSTIEIHVDVNIVDGVELNIEKFKQWRNGEYANAEFILEDGIKDISSAALKQKKCLNQNSTQLIHLT